MKPKHTYWYKITIHYCPVCGRERIYRERQYDSPKPERHLQYEVYEYYDWCDAL